MHQYVSKTLSQYKIIFQKVILVIFKGPENLGALGCNLPCLCQANLTHRQGGLQPRAPNL